MNLHVITCGRAPNRGPRILLTGLRPPAQRCAVRRGMPPLPGEWAHLWRAAPPQVSTRPCARALVAKPSRSAKDRGQQLPGQGGMVLGNLDMGGQIPTMQHIQSARPLSRRLSVSPPSTPTPIGFLEVGLAADGRVEYSPPQAISVSPHATGTSAGQSPGMANPQDSRDVSSQALRNNAGLRTGFFGLHLRAPKSLPPVLGLLRAPPSELHK